MIGSQTKAEDKLEGESRRSGPENSQFDRLTRGPKNKKTIVRAWLFILINT